MIRLIGFCLGMLGNLFAAWAHRHLWTWFVTPAFGIATPSVVQFYGIQMLIWSLFAFSSSGAIDTILAEHLAEHGIESKWLATLRAFTFATIHVSYLGWGYLIHRLSS